MNYHEARVYLSELLKYGSVLGLEHISELLHRLGNPQHHLRFVHVAGTNGKGSVIAYLSNILTHAGMRVGRYTSPHTFSYREIYQIDGKTISEEELALHLTRIALAVEAMEMDGFTSPTCFEVETALAMLYFKENHCDLAVLETGLGGRLDATNCIQTTMLEIITPISMDHTAALGNTLDKIAYEKAGIIKPNTAVVSAPQPPAAANIISSTCKKLNCRLIVTNTEHIHISSVNIEKQVFTYKNWQDIEISLAGLYQCQNAALALEAVNELRLLGISISDDTVYAGMKSTVWKGRFTTIAHNPRVIVDGAHNEAAAIALRNSLNIYFKNKRLYYIFGIFKDKDYRKIIEITAPPAYHIITVETPNNHRALPAKQLTQEVSRINSSVEYATSIEEAVDKTYNMANKNDVIIIFGSLSLLAEAEKQVLSRPRVSLINIKW